VVVAALAVRALTLISRDQPADGEPWDVVNQLTWTDDFIMVADTTVHPWGPLTSAVAYKTINSDGEIATEVSWEEQSEPYIADHQPTGMLIILNPAGDPTSVLESRATSFEMFPIPATDRLNIRSSDNVPSVSIVKLTGQIVADYTMSGREVSIDISGLNAGV
jgi:hypothetical protein